ncbi:MAG: DUF1080 domain-containing protein [Balneolaceae bacterium]|nr:DUF1080 domain-containing protein [Balneolaceae bacterium]
MNLNSVITSVILLSVLFFTTNPLPESTSTNPLVPLSQEEIDEGWELLFDGVNANEWRGYNMDGFPDETWLIEDGMLIFRPGDRPMSGHDLITKKQYSDFELELEWWISEGGNSGIFHHVVEQPGVEIYWSGIEMQIIDNDAVQGASGKQLSGALYDMKPAVPQNTRPQGEWNHVRIISDGPNMEYWQNGEKVVEFTRWSAEWYAMVRETKFECHPSFGNAPKGHIGLQDHGDEVRFRNIRIREL